MITTGSLRTQARGQTPQQRGTYSILYLPSPEALPASLPPAAKNLKLRLGQFAQLWLPLLVCAELSSQYALE
jgi:hypothetical protein